MNWQVGFTIHGTDESSCQALFTPYAHGRLGWLVARGHIFWPCRRQGTLVPCTLDPQRSGRKRTLGGCPRFAPLFLRCFVPGELGGEMIFLTWSAKPWDFDYCIAMSGLAG